MSDNSFEIKQRIKRFMQEKNMTIYQLALKSGVSEACIRNWYSKRNYAPNLEPLKKVANALEIPFVRLLIEDNEELYPMNIETKKFVDDYLTLNNANKQLVSDLIKQLKKNQ